MEAVVAVHNARAGLWQGRQDLEDLIEDVAGGEEHVARKDEVVLASLGGGFEALGKSLEGLGRDGFPVHAPTLAEAPHLAAEAMELGVGGENADRWSGVPSGER